MNGVSSRILQHGIEQEKEEGEAEHQDGDATDETADVGDGLGFLAIFADRFVFGHEGEGVSLLVLS